MKKRLDAYDFVAAKHHSSRRGIEVDLVVLHYTAGLGDADDVAEFFARGRRKASAHFGVGRDGKVVQMVDLDRNAWHAGPSSFRGEAPVGRRSIGIEICNAGWAYMDRLDDDRKVECRHRNPASRSKQWELYTDEQYVAVQKLIEHLKFEIPTIEFVTGHEDIANAHTSDYRKRKGAKVDPGPAWQWERLLTDSAAVQRWAFDFKKKLWVHVPEGVKL